MPGENGGWSNTHLQPPFLLGGQSFVMLGVGLVVLGVGCELKVIEMS